MSTPPPRKVKKTSKVHSKQVRVFDPKDGYRIRADCFCFRDSSRKEVVLVSCRNSIGKWTVPGGGLDPGEEPEETAVREVLEEAGVKGTIDSYVGSFDDVEAQTRTELYTMVLSGEMESWHDKTEMERQRRWFTVEEAMPALRAKKPLKCQFLEAACCAERGRRRTSHSGNSQEPALLDDPQVLAGGVAPSINGSSEKACYNLVNSLPGVAMENGAARNTVNVLP